MNSIVTAPDSKALTVNMLLTPIKHLIDSSDVDELTINRPNEIWTKLGSNWTKHAIPELTMGHIVQMITATCSYNNVRPSSNLSVVMPDGSRAQITQYPACIDGMISFNIRKHGSRVFSLDELEAQGAFDHWVDKKLDTGLSATDKMLMQLKEQRKFPEFMRQCVLHHKNIVIAGKTGSGKTTFARALIKTVPTTERIITIEDTHELFLPDHPNKLHLMYGTATGRISAEAALMACMRLSPDRIFLAELRGNEAWEYLNSLNTGHSGSITTVHANNATHTFERISTLIKQSDVGRTIELDTIQKTLRSTLDVILFYDNRQLKEIYFDPLAANAG